MFLLQAICQFAQRFRIEFTKNFMGEFYCADRFNRKLCRTATTAAVFPRTGVWKVLVPRCSCARTTTVRLALLLAGTLQHRVPMAPEACR